MPEHIKKQTLRRAFLLTSELSDKNIIRAINILEKFFVRGKRIKGIAQTIEKAFLKKHPAVKLVRDTLGRLSEPAKIKLIENLLVNAFILGHQKRVKLNKKFGFGLPSFFVISPTARCNLQCRGCYAGQYTKKVDLSSKELDRILTEAKDLGICFITISGGEPFLRKDLLDLYQKHNDAYFQVYTNGTCIDKKLAKQLAELGNVAPGISIEGFEKETDIRRGRGIFKKIMRAMDNLREAGVLFGFSATVTKDNSEILASEQFIDLMIQKGCSFGWYFQYVPIGRRPDISLIATPEQRNRLRMRVERIRKTKPIFIGDFWNDGPYVQGCMAGARPGGYFHINCQGDVEPCVFLQFSVDNIRGKKLIEVIQSPFFKAIQKAQPYCLNKNLLAPCALIDHPQILRKLVQEYKAKPSYSGIEAVMKNPQITDFLDQYSKEFQRITDPIWQNTLSRKFKHWKDYR